MRLDALRSALRGVARSRRYGLAIVAALTAGIGIGGSALGVLHLASLVPLRLSTSLLLDTVRAAGAEAWAAGTVSVAALQNDAFGGFLRILGGLGLLLIVIACLNVGVLLRARAAARRHDAAVRAALGATRGRLLAGALLQDGLLLSVGIALGLTAAVPGVALLRLTWPHAVAPQGMAADPRLLALAVAIPTVIVVSLRLLTRPDVPEAHGRLRGLLSGNRITAGRRDRPPRGLVIAQLAVSTVLLTTAWMLVEATRLRPDGAGHDEGGTISVALDLSGATRAADFGTARLYTSLLDRVGDLPGVRAESLSTAGTLVGMGPVGPAEAECRCYRSMIYLAFSPALVRRHAVSPGFFRAHDLTLVAGREFSRADGPDAPPVAIVSQSFADADFGADGALGRSVRIGGASGVAYTVVGVVEDVRASGIGSSEMPRKALYVPLLQHRASSLDLAVRTDGEPAATTRALTAAISGLGPSIRTLSTLTLAERLSRGDAPLRWLARVFGLVGLLALLLAAHGLWVIMRYSVARRRREIGVRAALGADPARIVRTVLGEALRTAGWGLALGAWLTTFAVGLLKLLAPRISILDPTAFLVVSGTLAAAALLGGWSSARKAARLDPAAALGSE